jgi:hypothetical protein
MAAEAAHDLARERILEEQLRPHARPHQRDDAAHPRTLGDRQFVIAA